MALHNALTGAELHETKGADAATAGQTLVATGVGTALYQVLLGNVVRVNSLSDLPTPSGGKITLLASTIYMFGANVNLGTDHLLFGAGTSVQSGAAFTVTITYTGTGAVFRGVDINATIKDLTVAAGTGDVYDFSESGGGNTNIIIITDVLITSCATVGTFTQMRTVIMDGNTVLSCDDGLVFVTTGMSGTRITSLALVSTSTSFIGLDFTGTTISNVNLDGLVLIGGTGSIGIKGDAGSVNIATGFIGNVTNAQFAGVTTALSGITIDDIRWNFQDNGSLADTMPDALLSLTANATATTLSVGVPTLVAGTFVDERSSQFTNTAAGRSTYNGERDLLTPIDADVVIDPAGANKSMRAFIALNGTAIVNSGKAVNISSGDPKQITLHWQINMSENDFVEIFIENETDSVNATVIDATLRMR